MLRFDKATIVSLLFKFILSLRLTNSLWGLDVLLLPEFINIVFILYENCVEFIILLYNFLVISFARLKEYRFFHIGKFSDVLPAFNCARGMVIFKPFVEELIFLFFLLELFYI